MSGIGSIIVLGTHSLSVVFSRPSRVRAVLSTVSLYSTYVIHAKRGATSGRQACACRAVLRRSVARRGAGFAEFSLGKIADNVRERKVSHVHAHSVHSVASAQTVALGQAVGRLDLPCNEHLTRRRKMVIAGRIGPPQAAACLAGKFSADGAVRRTAAREVPSSTRAALLVSHPNSDSMLATHDVEYL